MKKSIIPFALVTDVTQLSRIICLLQAPIYGILLLTQPTLGLASSSSLYLGTFAGASDPAYLRKRQLVISAYVIMQIPLEANENAYKEDITSANTSYDICNPDFIYDEVGGFKYSLPRKVLETWLSGKAFDHPEVYTEAESIRLQEDINEIFQNILSINPVRKKLAVMTAGAPGAGKTIKMRQELKKEAFEGRKFAYICPDDVCLQNQSRTFKADIECGKGTKEERQLAYNKWRPGSNAATHFILGHLIKEQYAFYFGTTSSGPATGIFFEFLKKQGYQIRLIHITAPDNVRWKSIQERDKTFVQTTKRDVKEKGLLLPQRIMDTFLAFADEIEFYYRDGVNKDAQLAAKWIRSESSSEVLGTLQIISPSRYEQIKAIHNAATEVLERQDLQWEATVEKNSLINCAEG